MLELPDEERALVREGPPPRGGDAMRAKLTDARFSDPAWIFERKLDGIRCIAVRDRGAVHLWSRNDLPLDGRYPELVQALGAEAAPSFAIDGEIVAFDRGRTSFARLAQRGQRPVAAYLYVFDVLWLDGCDVRGLPLRSRKRILRRALAFRGRVRLTAHRNADGEAYFAEACRRGWEGLIAKRADSTYGSRRSGDWLKFKCEHGQELVIGGYTAPRGSRTRLGALLVGVYDGDALRYAGKVGTGFDHATLDALGDRLDALRSERPPFADADAIRERDVTWVRPQLVAQIGFTEWTGQGRLRHPRFQGLREDKAARDVVREAP
ncbi:MAG: bifunctional non-ous end joining protein LigD [Solirubrobacteraceae bacterium]|jgi:bifunctional non-homologous end joining protein LigD|nr:bifunctional non-ous end joining protein LigD [Solirubrobacteraceae bacterium]